MALLPPPGEDRIEILDDGRLLEHGTSLSLMTKASQCFEKDFDCDPSRDWNTWTSRYQGAYNFSLYYAVVSDAEGRVQCALRAVLDHSNTAQLLSVSTVPSSRSEVKRIMIDYVLCESESRGQGLASTLTNFVLEMARAQGANVFVVSTEDSAAFWMKKSFVLEENAALNKRFNMFRDTYLLRLESNRIDEGELIDFVMSSSEEEEEEEKEVLDQESDSGSSEEDDSDDSGLQRALFASVSLT